MANDGLSDLENRITQHDREIAEQRHELKNAKTVFELKLQQVVNSLDELKRIMKWAGGMIVTLMISFMSWSALQQYNSNERQKDELAQQIRLIQNQEQATKDREAILRQLRDDLSASGAEATVTTDSSR